MTSARVHPTDREVGFPGDMHETGLKAVDSPRRERTPLVIGSREDVGFVADTIRRVSTSARVSGAVSQPAL